MSAAINSAPGDPVLREIDRAIRIRKRQIVHTQLERSLLLFDLDEARRDLRDLTREVWFDCDECGELNLIDLDETDVIQDESFLHVVNSVIDRLQAIVEAIE